MNSNILIGKELLIAKNIAIMNGKQLKVFTPSQWLLGFNWLSKDWERPGIIYVSVSDGIVQSIVRET
jgi:hypothetical protein